MRKLRVWHRRLSGLALVPWIWFALSGGALSVAHAFRELRTPVFNRGSTLSREDQLARALSLGPEKIRRIDFADSTAALHVELAGEASYFGEQLQRFDEPPWISFLTRLHRGKFLALPGQIIFSLIAAFLIFFTLSGILIWRPRAKRGAREWHRWIGAAASLPLLILFLSGGLWNISVLIRQAPPKSEKVVLASDWRAAFANADKLDSRLKSLHKTSGNILAELDDGTRIYFGAGQVSISRPWTREGWIEPFFNIHSGRIWGWFGRGLAALTTVLSLGLVVTGLAL